MRRRTLFIIVLNTLVILVACELVARGMLWYSGLIAEIPERQFGYSASGYGDLLPNLNSVERLYQIRPFFLQTNSAGLRNVAEIDDDPNVFRVLAVGDSFVYGYYVHNQETFPARLEEVLNQRLKARVQVLNAGVPGYTIADELSYLQDKGLKLEPDLVVFGFYTNDIFDFYPVIREHFARSVALSQQQPAEQPPSPAQQFLYDNLGLFRVFWTARYAALQWEIGDLVNRATPTIEGLHQTYQNLTFLTPDAYPDEWAAYERTLRETYALLKERNIPAVMVAFPDLAQMPLEGGVPDAPQRMLARVTADIGMPYLDLLPVFQEAGDIQSLYLMYYKDDAQVDPNAPDAAVMAYTGDGHPSPYSYLVTARVVADLLIQRELVPE